MNNRKNQYSILFLTTLGVYLGLVFIGASPVLGHAAMTRNFEIKDEIEIADDLDTKPDDELSGSTDPVQIYLQEVEYFIESLRNLHHNGSFVTRNDPRFSFKLNTSTFTVDVTSLKRFQGGAHLWPALFDHRNNAPVPLKANAAEPSISKSDGFKFHRSQTFVVTRLPRAGLESLLASRAK